MKFRKKPIVIDAWRFYGTRESFDLLADAVGAFFISDDDHGQRRAAFNAPSGQLMQLILADDTVVIPTLEGDMEAAPGDWIIRGIKGELYPCKPDIFAATYEAVE